jgi:hypothetical protein
MTDPIETALRSMLRERAGDVTEVPGAALDLDQPHHAAPAQASHRSWFLVAASIVAVLAVAAGVVGIQRATRHRSVAGPTNPVTPTSQPPTQPSTQASPPISAAARQLQWSFDLTAPSGYQLLDRSITPRFQTASLRLLKDPDATSCCGGLPHTVYVTVYSAGAFDSHGVTGGTRFDVGAVQGYLGSRPPGLANAGTRVGDQPLPTVSWQYRPDAWATVQATTPATQQPAQLRRVAAAVRPGATGVLRTPVRLGYVPESMKFAQLTDDLVEGSGANLTLTRGPLGAVTTTQLSVQVWSDPGPHQDLGAATTVGGRPGRLLTGDFGASVVIGRREVVLTITGPLAFRADLGRITASVQWASNPADPATWFDARTSLP